MRLEVSWEQSGKERGSPSCESPPWATRPTEGAPTPHNTGVWGSGQAQGEGGQLTFLQAVLGLPEQRRCQLRPVTA